MRNVCRQLLLLFSMVCITAIPSFAQTIIKGTVKSAANQTPLEGAAVTVQGSTSGVITNSAGEFSIKASPKDILVISSVGFESQNFLVGSNKSLSIKLNAAKNELDDVVVIGYGRVNRKDLTGSVVSVNITEMAKAPVKSFDAALFGRVAGVQVVSPDGPPGAMSTIFFRGGNSVSPDSCPLHFL